MADMARVLVGNPSEPGGQTITGFPISESIGPPKIQWTSGARSLHSAGLRHFLDAGRGFGKGRMPQDAAGKGPTASR